VGKYQQNLHVLLLRLAALLNTHATVSMESPYYCRDIFDPHHFIVFTISVVNMAAQFTTCSKYGQSAVNRFLWIEGVRGAKIQ
jgi:hypothetical protein